MNWKDNNAYCRSVSDKGYLLTWTWSNGSKWMRAWAPRRAGERRGKYLGCGYERAELERICAEHYARNVSRFSVEHEARA